MRSGPIKPETIERAVDRRELGLPLWERGASARVDLPWRDVAGLDAGELESLLEKAGSAIVVLGTSAAARVLLAGALAGAAKGTRLYIYADAALEADRAFLPALAAQRERVLARLGPRPPADWLIVDGGRTGRLLIGPKADARRWTISVEDSQARALFEAFRALFWFHASREALPDSAGNLAWRAPLPAPFADPGPRIQLAAGALDIGGPPEPIADAQVRYSPTAVDPGRAAMIFVPPVEASGRTVELALAQSLHQRGGQVRWVDLGLPRTTITRERVQLELIDAPICIRIEWPRAVAVDMIHRFERAGRSPEWAFHPQRRLGDIAGEVLLAGETNAQSVTPKVEIPLPDVVCPLLDFDGPQPVRFPEPGPLTLAVVYRWRRVPQGLPPGARTADLVQRWRAVDEWAARAVEQLRDAIAQLERQEGGWLERLRRWLPARDPVRSERRRLAEQIETLGEARPSSDPAGAAERCAQLEAIAARTYELARAAVDERQRAEDQAADEEQRAAWTKRRDDAAAALERTRARLVEVERELGELSDRGVAAEATLRDAIEARRGEHKATLENRRAELTRELEQVEEERTQLKEQHKGSPPKAAHGPLQRRKEQLERELADNRKELAAVATWTPAKGVLGAFSDAVTAAREATRDVERRLRALQGEASAHESVLGEPYRFVQPSRQSLVPLVPLVSHPAVPGEALPELGELFESQNRRYLAIATWEQLKRAAPVAQRLKATLVARPADKKV